MGDMSNSRKLLLAILALVATIEVVASEAGCRECEFSELEARLSDAKEKLALCEEALQDKASSAGKDSYMSQERKDHLFGHFRTVASHLLY